MSLEEIADRLYALAPEDFTAARATEAKTADKPLAKQVTALRKPTVGAWLVNTLAREEPDLLDQLLDLGPALAEAQRAGQGDTLRQLGDQRRQLIGAVTARVFELAGRAPVAAARAEVESTLEAALADPASADAVRSGRLVRALSYAGFGEVDTTDAVAGPGAASQSRKPPAKAPGKPSREPAAKGQAQREDTRKRDIAAAEARALDAAGSLDDAVRACEQARGDQEQAEAEQREAQAAVATAEAALRDARDARTAAEDAARKATRIAAKAEQAVKDAQTQAEKTRNQLDRLRRA